MVKYYFFDFFLQSLKRSDEGDVRASPNKGIKASNIY
jgi:hypothetical protein